VAEERHLELTPREQAIYEAGVHAGAAQAMQQLAELCQREQAEHQARAAAALARAHSLGQPSNGAALGGKLGRKLRALIDA
jgi:hypothetical protein